MEIEWGKPAEMRFTGQECPWVQRAPDDGIIITYYEASPGALKGQPVEQKRLTLRLNKREREQLKGLL